MGKRGRKTTPTALKVLRGNPRNENLSGKAEPKPKRLKGLRPPRGLSKEARKVWRDMASKLDALGLLTEVDVNALMRYCDSFVRWIQTKDFLDANGFFYSIYFDQTEEERKAGKEPRVKYQAQYPQANLYIQLSKELSRLEAQFGLTPSARAILGAAARPLGDSERDKIRSKLYG